MVATDQYIYDVLYFGRETLRLTMYNTILTPKDFDVVMSCIRRTNGLDIVLTLKHIL